jgi:hypothetical protein
MKRRSEDGAAFVAGAVSGVVEGLSVHPLDMVSLNLACLFSHISTVMRSLQANPA